MNVHCPVCGIHFEREMGYFTGAMVVSYGLSILCYLAIFLFLRFVVIQPLGWLFVLEMLLLYLPFLPLVFRYSRILWIHFDRAFHPDD